MIDRGVCRFVGVTHGDRVDSSATAGNRGRREEAYIGGQQTRMGTWARWPDKWQVCPYTLSRTAHDSGSSHSCKDTREDWKN
jgi:hypothetical protein